MNSVSRGMLQQLADYDTHRNIGTLNDLKMQTYIFKFSYKTLCVCICVCVYFTHIFSSHWSIVVPQQNVLLGTWIGALYTNTLHESESHSVVSYSLRPHGLYRPWNSPGQNTGVGDAFPSPGDLPNPGIEPRSPSLQADSLSAEPPKIKDQY